MGRTDATETPADGAAAVTARNNVVIGGLADGQPMLFAHGFGCDQSMWRLLAPRFEATHRTILFDHVGMGHSDITAHDPVVHSTLDGYAADVLAICEALDLRDVVFVGHSVSAMIGVLAANQQPQRFAGLVLIGPSPRYIDDDGYRGGFTAEDIDDLLHSLDSNYLGWSATMAPVIMGNDERPELADELTNSFCRTHPEIARTFARATFLGDNRRDLAEVRTPTLVLQCTADVIAPEQVGRYVHEQIAGSRFAQLQATGHCPNLSAPDETADAIRAFLSVMS
ncbi:alpha/beta hydrolase [soil metagenome]